MSQGRKNILAISGSTRRNSSNHNLLKAIAALTADSLDLHFLESIAALPHFDPDQDNEQPPQPVIDFRQKLGKADGIIICTPEYAHGVPGTLKNALDWTVSSGDFSHKPTVLITASTDGRFGHQALLETLRVIEAKDIDQFQLLISFIKTKVDGSGTITDEKTRTAVKQLMQDFIRSLT